MPRISKKEKTRRARISAGLKRHHAHKRKLAELKLAAKAFRRRSKAATLGWERRRKRDKAEKRKAKAEFERRSKASALGWKRKRKKIEAEKERLAEPLPIVEFPVPKQPKQDWLERIDWMLKRLARSEDDTIISVRNSDNTVDGELTVATHSGEQALAFMAEIADAGEERLEDSPRLWVTIGIRAEGEIRTKSKPRLKEGPGDFDSIADPGGLVFTRWLPISGWPYATATAEAIIEDMGEAENTGEIMGITIRLRYARANPRD